MPNISVAPVTQASDDPHLNGGRSPKDAPKPAGHYRANVGLVVVLMIVLPLFFLLTGCGPVQSPSSGSANAYSKYSLSHTAPAGKKSPFDTFQDMSGTYAHLRAAAQTGNPAECRRGVSEYNADYKALQNAGVSAAHLRTITDKEGIPHRLLAGTDCSN